MLSDYKVGMERLLAYLGQQHPRYSEALTYQQQLNENIQRAKRYGDNATLQSRRAEIVEQLNSLALSTVGKSFNELCRRPDVMIEAPPPPKFRHRAKFWKVQGQIAIFLLVALSIIFAWHFFSPSTELKILSGPTAAKSNLQAAEQIQVSVQAEGEGLTYVWSADNGSISTSGPTAQSTITYIAPGFVGDDWIRVEIRDKDDHVVTTEIKITVVQEP